MRFSGFTQPNPQLEEWNAEDYRDRDNLAFFADAVRALDERRFGDGRMFIGFLGQRDIPGVTLRQAQSVLRWDLRPSLWSHVFLLAEPADREGVAETRILEVPMYSRTGEFPRPERNAVSEGTLLQYADPARDANLALVAVSMSLDATDRVARRALEYNVDRLRYDLWAALGAWQSYVWSSGAAPNPLREGYPIAASAYVEMAFEAINLDLTPGASERNSSPEHLWAAAKWWNQPLAQTEGRALAGAYILRDRGCSLLDADWAMTPLGDASPADGTPGGES
jgi:hypothetical protein